MATQGQPWRSAISLGVNKHIRFSPPCPGFLPACTWGEGPGGGQEADHTLAPPHQGPGAWPGAEGERGSALSPTEGGTGTGLTAVITESHQNPVGPGQGARRAGLT